MDLLEAEASCENLNTKQNSANLSLAQRDFEESWETSTMWFYIDLHFVLHNPFIEPIEQCQSKVHGPCSIAIIHTYQLLKGRFPEHRFHYANQSSERY